MMATIALTQISCATLEKDECAVANWYELGRADGERGRKVTRATSYREDCAKFGIPIDGNGYRAGWDLGIRQYCTPKNGFDRGINGRFYNRSCPANLAGQFEQPFNLGREIHDLDRSVQATQLKIDQLNVELDADGVPREIRKELRRERRSLRQERREYRETLDYAVSEARQRGFSVSY
jgi:hypothetical protein